MWYTSPLNKMKMLQTVQHFFCTMYCFLQFCQLLGHCDFKKATIGGLRNLIFCMQVGLGPIMFIFCKSRSKVKGHGQKSGKMCLFEPFLTTGGQHGSHREWLGSAQVLLAAYQFFFWHNAKSHRTSHPLWQVPAVSNLPITANMQKISMSEAWSVARCELWEIHSYFLQF